MLRVGIDSMPTPPAAVAKMPPRPVCEICGGCGYLLPDGMQKPAPFDWNVIVENALPCGCRSGEQYRQHAREWAEPIVYRDKKTILRERLVLPW